MKMHCIWAAILVRRRMQVDRLVESSTPVDPQSPNVLSLFEWMEADARWDGESHGAVLRSMLRWLKLSASQSSLVEIPDPRPQANTKNP